jgi:hypothetical protein
MIQKIPYPAPQEEEKDIFEMNEEFNGASS